MKDPSILPEAPEQPGTVFQFPLQQVLSSQQAAGYLGVSEKRLRILALFGGGPARVRQGGATPHYRKDDLDAYSAALFSYAGLSDDELARYRSNRTASGFSGIDRFMDMASRDELSQACAFIGGRIAIVLGMVVIVLSHTPLSRMLFHMQ